MKQKTKVLFGATLTTAMCASLIAGTTYALFTSESEVNVAITSAKLAVTANVKNLQTGFDGDYVNEASATADFNETTKMLTVENMAPGDKVTFQVNVSAAATIDFQYRLKFGFESENEDLFRQLLIGVGDPAEEGAEVAYDYYSEGVTAWMKHAATGKDAVTVETKEVVVEMPYYVSGEQYMGKTCKFAFAVEAVQGNANKNDEASALKTHVVKTDDELNTALGEIKDGETLVLWGNHWENETVKVESETLTKLYVNGDKVGAFEFNTPNADVKYYNAYTNVIQAKAVADNSLHIFGKAEELVLNQGKAVIESGATTEKVTANVAEGVAAKLVIAEEAKANTVAIEKGKVTVEHSGVIGTFATEANTEVVLVKSANATIENEAFAENTVVAANIVEVNDETTLFAAIAEAPENSIIELTADFNVAKKIEINKSLTIRGNGHAIVSSVNRGIVVVSNNVEVNLLELKLLGKGLERCAQVDPKVTGVKLNIERCNFTATYYTVNICGDAEVDLTIKNSELTGWGAVNAWSAGYSIHVSDSILRGINDKSFDAVGWNDFGTVVLEGDTTYKTDEASERIDVELKNCKIIAESPSGNIQNCILFNSGSKENHVKLIDCEFEMKDKNCTFLIDNGLDNELTILDSQKVVNVSTNEQFIAALANAKSGTIIKLAEGTYSPTANNQFVLRANNVMLVGSGIGKTVIDAQKFDCSGQAGFLVSGDNVVVCNLTVKTTSDNGNVSALKVTKVSPEAGFVEKFQLVQVAIEGSKGHGLNLHTVKDALIYGSGVVSFGKVGISLAEAVNVHIDQVEIAKVEGAWADIGFMYDSSEEKAEMYDTPSTVTVTIAKDFKNGKIYSERPLSEGYDSLTIEYDENEAQWEKIENEKGQVWAIPESVPVEPAD